MLRRRTPMTAFFVNGKRVDLDVDPSTPLLWVIREQLGLTGTKYGCGMAHCGACTVQIDGNGTARFSEIFGRGQRRLVDRISFGGNRHAGSGGGIPGKQFYAERVCTDWNGRTGDGDRESLRDGAGRLHIVAHAAGRGTR